MSLYKKFELGEVIRDDGVKSFQAKDLTSDRQVQVHLIMGIPGRLPPPYELLDQLKQLPEANRAHVLETGEQSGTPYVVTLPLDGFAGFRDWLSEKTGGTLRTTAQPKESPKENKELSRVGRWKIPTVGEAPVAPAPPPPQPQPANRALDDTQLFGHSAAPESRPDWAFVRPLSPSPAPPQTPPPPAPAPSVQPGDFTQAFLAKSISAPQPAPEPPPAPAVGEFTMAFGTPAFSPAAPAPEPLGSGEFTQAFAVPSLPPSAPSMPAPTLEPGPTPGEVTKLFATPPLATPPSSGSEQGEFTRAFSSPSFAKSSPPSAPVPAPEEDTLRLFPAVRQEPNSSLAPPPPPGLGLSTPAPTPVTGAPPPFGRDVAPMVTPAGSDAFQATRGFAVPQPGSVPQPAGPGEYTRVFGAPSVSPAPVPAPTPAAAPKNRTWLLVVLGVLIVIILAGLIVTLLKK